MSGREANILRKCGESVAKVSMTELSNDDDDEKNIEKLVELTDLSLLGPPSGSNFNSYTWIGVPFLATDSKNSIPSSAGVLGVLGVFGVLGDSLPLFSRVKVCVGMSMVGVATRPLLPPLPNEVPCDATGAAFLGFFP